MKNKFIAIILCIVMVLGLVGCKQQGTNANVKIPNVVCTIFPQYDWARQIIGENNKDINLDLLIKNGVDLHNYQPTTDDIIKISECDLFIYVGGESDAWVEDVLKNAKNKDMQAINLMDVLGDNVKEEEIIEGMDASDEHEHEEDEHSAEHKHSEEPEYDEHVWLSIKNAKAISQAIADALCKIDTNNEKTYQANAKEYINRLNDLDSLYQEMVVNANNNTVLFGDRFPFRYLVDDYKINYYAAFVGCSAETEASFETIVFLANKADELALSSICIIDGSNEDIAKTIISNTNNKNQNIIVMNSMQSITSEDIDKGVTYISVMEDNLKALKEAMN